MSLTLKHATTIVEAALRQGRETGCAPLAVAVLDAGGHLKAFAREDGAGIVRPQIAVARRGGRSAWAWARARWPVGWPSSRSSRRSSPR